jgi:predicted acyltransferase
MAWDHSFVVYTIGMGLLGLVASWLAQLLTRLVAMVLLAGVLVSAVIALGIVHVPEEILHAGGHAVGQFVGSLIPFLKEHGNALRGLVEGLLRDQPQVGVSAFAVGFFGGLILRHLRH